MASKNSKATSPPQDAAASSRHQRRRSSRSPSPRHRSTRRYSDSSPEPPAERERERSSRRSGGGDRDRDRERHRRRSGRDSGDVDSDRDREHRRRSNGHDSHRRASVARSARDEVDDDDDDVRSQRSVRSSRRYDSRERDVRDRDYDRRRQSSSRPHGYDYDYDAYYRGPPPPRRGGYDYYSPRPDARYERHHSQRRSSPPRPKTPTPEPDDYERRSVFCSQLSARLTQRDLGEFFEEKLGEDTVKDVRIVTDRNTGRSKGIGYVELRSEDLVRKAIDDCSGTKIYGIPILVQLTEAARNRGEGASTAAAPIRPNLITQLNPAAIGSLPLPPHLATSLGVAPGHRNATYHADTDARLYIGSLHFSITAEDLKAVFEPFGEIDHVDLHKEPTGKSKGYAFVQFKRPDDAEKAIEHMDNFELAGRNIRVGHVNARGQEGKTSAQLRAAAAGGGAGQAMSPVQASSSSPGGAVAAAQAAAMAAGNTATLTSSYDDGGGGGLTSQSRANLMAMLARNDSSQASSTAPEQVRPASIPEAKSKGVLLKNMFNPEE